APSPKPVTREPASKPIPRGPKGPSAESLSPCLFTADCGDGLICEEGHCVRPFIRDGAAMRLKGSLDEAVNAAVREEWAPKAGATSCSHTGDCPAGLFCSQYGHCTRAPDAVGDAIGQAFLQYTIPTSR